MIQLLVLLPATILRLNILIIPKVFITFHSHLYFMSPITSKVYALIKLPYQIANIIMCYQSSVNSERVEEAVTDTTTVCCKLIRRHKFGNMSVQCKTIFIKTNASHWQIVIFMNN